MPMSLFQLLELTIRIKTIYYSIDFSIYHSILLKIIRYEKHLAFIVVCIALLITYSMSEILVESIVLFGTSCLNSSISSCFRVSMYVMCSSWELISYRLIHTSRLIKHVRLYFLLSFKSFCLIIQVNERNDTP